MIGLALIIGAGGLLASALIAACSRKLRARIRSTLALLPHATRGEKILLISAVVLLLLGPLLIGPLDELLALALLGKLAQRIGKRLAQERQP